MADTAVEGAIPVDTAGQDRAAAKAQTRAAVRWLAERGRAVRGWLTLAVAAGCVGALATIVEAWAIATAIGHAAARNWDAALAPLPWLALAIAVKAAAVWAQDRAGIEAGARVRAAVRAGLYRGLSRPDAGVDLPTASVPVHLIDQVEALDAYYARYVPLTRLAVLVPVILGTAALYANWVAGLLLFLTAPLIPVFMALIGMGAAQASKQQFDALQRLGRRFLDRLQGLTSLQIMGRAEEEGRRLEAVADEHRKRTMQVLRIAFLSSAVLEFFASVAIAIVALYLGSAYLGLAHFGVPEGGVTLAAGLFVLLLAPEFFQPLRQFAGAYHDRANAVAAATDLMTLPLVEGGDAAPAIPMAAMPGPTAVSIAGLTVRREGRAGFVLDRLELELPPGSLTAIVGPSGLGKSTLLDALMGFAPVDAGVMTIAGRPAGPATLPLIAWAGQRPHLFAGTIRHNIAMGHPGATDAAIEAAARDAGVLAFAAELPLGLDTPVGERGFGLSGGQARRVALARAFLKPAPLLLLDEPTADLDPATEELVLAGIRARAGRQTVLMVTHGARAAAIADAVHRLERGRLVPADGVA